MFMRTANRALFAALLSLSFVLLLVALAGEASAASAALPATITVPTMDADGVYSVQWTASATSGATYVLQEATNSIFTIGVREAYRGPALIINIPKPLTAKTYYYRVKAIKTAYTDSAWRTGGNGCAVPGTATAGIPTAVMVPVSDADGAFAVSWTTLATPGELYSLQEATNSTFTSGLRTAYTGAAKTVAILGRAQNTTYYYRVRAMKPGYRDSAWRVGNNGCAVPGTMAGAPAAITVPTSDADGSYMVSWTASATAGVSYQLQEATNSAFTSGQRTIAAGSALRLAISGRTPGRVYYYRVRALKPGYTASLWRSGVNGCTIPPQVVSLVGRWLWLNDSDGTAPATGAECALVFFANGQADFNCFMPSQVYHDHGTYSVAAANASGLNLTLTLADYGVAMTSERVPVVNGRLTLPFMNTSNAAGTSVWVKQSAPAIDNTDFVAVAFKAYEDALLNGMTDHQAALAAENALATGTFVSNGYLPQPTSPGIASSAALEAGSQLAAAPIPLREVILNTQSTAIKVVKENGRVYNIILKPKSPSADEYAANPSLSPLTPGFFAGDPRTQLYMAQSSGPNDPAQYSASLLFPMNSQIAFRKGSYYSFRAQGENPAFLQTQLLRAGYTAANIHVRSNAQVTPRALADELLRNPGVFYISTHGTYFKATATQPADFLMITGSRVTVAPGQSRDQALSAAVLALGLPPYLESTIEPVVLEVGRLQQETFLGVSRAFFEALRTNNPSWNMSKSLVFLDACSSTSHDDNVVPISRAMLNNPAVLLGWRVPSDAFVSVRYSQHFFQNAVRKTHSAREVLDETWRVLRTRRSIYAEDELLDDADNSTNRKSLAAQIVNLEAFGLNGAPYLHLGDNLYTDTQPDIVFWLTWLGRWNQTPDIASTNLQSCFDNFWKLRKKGLGVSPLCNQGYVGDHFPTANEVKEARQLINGAPPPVARGRWTLADKIPYGP